MSTPEAMRVAQTLENRQGGEDDAADERDDGRAGICGPDAVLWEPKA